MSILIRALVLALVLSVLTSAPADASDPWPRELSDPPYTLVVHHPVIDRWADYAVLEGWLPVEVRGDGGASWVGSVRARATTTIDLDRRLVSLDGQEVLEVRFSDPDTPAAVTGLARQAVQAGGRQVALDEVLAVLAEDFQPPAPAGADPGFNRAPPRIVVSETPVQLLLIDQEPVRAPIDGTELQVVVNTDWDLFFHVPAADWYVINQGVWQTQSLLASGNWRSVDELPGDFQSLAVGEDWERVRAALPPRVPDVAPPPFVVSLEPTELVVVDGAPRLQSVPDAGGLEVVANTGRDLFRLDGRWYLLASGRWFSAADLDGEWVTVDTLPPAFAAIPADHGRAHVRRSVPGTVEAAVAYIEATLPQASIVPAGAVPGREVVYVGEPQFEPIPNTRLERAVNTPFAVIRHNNFHYLAFEAAWYASASPLGPWRVTTTVPEEVFGIPPSDPLYFVTYLRPLGNQPGNDEARFSYTEGYNGRYTIGLRAVEGTGWRYDPWVGYPMGRPVYWGYPWTYGGPWGAWGPPGYWTGYQPLQRLEIEGPQRGVGSANAQAAPSEQDPRLARRSYDYSTLEQQRTVDSAGLQRAAQDLYAAPDGTVYRREGDDWARHEDGEWDTMGDLQRQYGVASPATGAPVERQRQAYRQNQKDIERMDRYYERRANSYNMYSEVWVGR